MKLFLDEDRLSRFAAENRERYETAPPFPHVVLDDVLPAAALERVLEEFPAPDSEVW